MISKQVKQISNPTDLECSCPLSECDSLNIGITVLSLWERDLAFDDPVVWVLIIALVVFLFGSNKIPQVARALGQAKKEFDNGWKGVASEVMNPRPQQPPGATQPQLSPVPNTSAPTSSQSIPSTDPLVIACQNEGIDTMGKTREQLAAELSWKLNKK